MSPAVGLASHTLSLYPLKLGATCPWLEPVSPPLPTQSAQNVPVAPAWFLSLCLPLLSSLGGKVRVPAELVRTDSPAGRDGGWVAWEGVAKLLISLPCLGPGFTDVFSE